MTDKFKITDDGLSFSPDNVAAHLTGSERKEFALGTERNNTY